MILFVILKETYTKDLYSIQILAYIIFNRTIYISRGWTFIQHGEFYFVLCSFELNIDAGKYLKNNTHSYLYIYIFFLI
jgi:hypothetical protein